MRHKIVMSAFSSICSTRHAPTPFILEKTGAGTYRIARKMPHGVEWPAGRAFVSATEVLGQITNLVATLQE